MGDLPGTINVLNAVWRLVYLGKMMEGMGAAVITLITQLGGPGVDGLWFIVLSSIILFGVQIWMAQRIWRTIGTSRDQKAGTLRQGVLVGPEGVLVRLTSGYP